MANETMKSREYPVPPGSYIYIQEVSSGKIKTLVGPTAATLTANDVPIVYNEGVFKRTDTLEEAIQKSVMVPEGWYCVLMNPPRTTGSQPAEGAHGAIPELQSGHEVVVEGPRMFALWPGQSAEVIEGHVLRSNQYLFCRVHNEEEARANISKTKLVKRTPEDGEVAGAPAGGADVLASGGSTPAASPAAKSAQAAIDEKGKLAGIDVANLTVGKTFIIKGKEFSFYIPQTGITVLPDEERKYVRDAVTLEQLEYCVLLSESGNKRYLKGPDVVFPEPTETFMRVREAGDDGQEVARTKFRAIELNEIQGIHVKVTKAYKDEKLGERAEGDEIFITGKNYPIYFPREEHIAVKYDGKMKHFAVAVPTGEGRYVMDRLKGTIAMVKGPDMLLPDPTKEIIVRRALSDKECELWYPANQEVLAYNRAIRELAKNTPTTRGGAVSDGDVDRGRSRRGMVGDALKSAGAPVAVAAAGIGEMSFSVSNAAYQSTSRRAMMDSSTVSNERVQMMGDEISRSSTFNQPRTLMLNTKFEGSPRIIVWTGYAVQVVNASGVRRVVEGPANILLEYDETLEILSLSTGRPKTTDKLLVTPYLLVKNNKVSDLIEGVETSDHVKVNIKVSYLVNFVGEKGKWFDVGNYVKFMCDYMRSLLKAKAKTTTIEEFYKNPLPIVRNVVLGERRDRLDREGEQEDGTLFEENNMRVSDVELLDITIPDAQVSAMLQEAQKSVVRQNVELATLRQKLAATKEKESILVEEAIAKAKTEAEKRQLAGKEIAEKLVVTLATIASELSEAQKRKEVVAAREILSDVSHAAGRERLKAAEALTHEIAEAAQMLEIERLKAETEALVSKFKAIEGGFSESLLALSSQEALVKVAEALSVQKLIGGESAVDVIEKFFAGSGLQSIMSKIAKRAGGLNGHAEKEVSGTLTAPQQS